MKEQKILVLGGKGKTGRKVAERLSKLGKFVRLGSRSENPPFDWENPESWGDTLNGMDAVYITFQPDLAVPGAIKAIEAFTALAVESGITKMVLLSGRGEKEAQICEQVVMNAGVDWTVVRASWFNQNFSESFFLEPLLAGEVALPRGETLEPFVDTDDIADVVVAALSDQKHTQKIYELTGPRLLTLKEITTEISKVTGRDIRFKSVEIAEYINMLSAHKVSEDHLWLINYLFTEVLDGRNATITHDVEKVLGRKAKDFAQYAMETHATGIWNPQNKG